MSISGRVGHSRWVFRGFMLAGSAPTLFLNADFGFDQVFGCVIGIPTYYPNIVLPTNFGPTTVPPTSPTSPASIIPITLHAMDTQLQTRRKGLRGLFKRKQNDTPKPVDADDPSGSATVQQIGSLDLDTARTNTRHQKACELLLACLPNPEQDDTWKFLDFSDLESKATFDDGFAQKLNAILESKRGPIKDNDSWKKLCKTLECIFAALIPLSRNFLSIANPGQSVGPL